MLNMYLKFVTTKLHFTKLCMTLLTNYKEFYTLALISNYTALLTTFRVPVKYILHCLSFLKVLNVTLYNTLNKALPISATILNSFYRVTR